MRIFNLLNSLFVNRGEQLVRYYCNDDELRTSHSRVVTMYRHLVRVKHHVFRNAYVWCITILAIVLFCGNWKIAFWKIALDWNLDWKLDWNVITLTGGLFIILLDGTHYPYGWDWIGIALSFRMEIIILLDGTLLELRSILVLCQL